MLTSNLKITNEDYVTPTQNFQFAFHPYRYEQEDQNLGVTDNNDLPHVAGKLTYCSQKYKNHIGSAVAPEKSVPADTKLVNFTEDKGVSTSAFWKRLFKLSDSVQGSVYCNDNASLNSHVTSVKLVQTDMNKGKSWSSNSNQKLQYSADMFIANNAFLASEIGKGMFKVSTLSLSSQPHDIQSNSLLFLVGFMKAQTNLHFLEQGRIQQ